jgi:hypothetical protein
MNYPSVPCDLSPNKSDLYKLTMSIYRLYYGSGERRFLAVASSESMHSQFSDSRPPSSLQSGSPSVEHLPLNLYSSRRRPRGVNPQGIRPISDSGSLEIAQFHGNYDFRILPGLRKQTSSIWSPHLRHDRRASRYSIWEPPSISWSAESGLLGRRNIQIVLFIAGFLVPFGIASLSYI